MAYMRFLTHNILKIGRSWTLCERAPIVRARRTGRTLSTPGGPVFGKIFTWWNGATIGTLFTLARRGVFIGQDDFGNRYYEAKDARDSYDGRKRRWVIYEGYADGSKVPPE